VQKNSTELQKVAHKKLTKTRKFTHSICLTSGKVWCLHMVEYYVDTCWSISM